MLAVRVHAYGGPEQLVLEDTPIPRPAQDEVLVRVRAAGAGVVEATGEAIFGLTNPSFIGGYAQYAVFGCRPAAEMIE